MFETWRYSEITCMWMPQDLTLGQVMARCHLSTSHCLSQYWPRSMSPYAITRPQLDGSRMVPFWEYSLPTKIQFEEIKAVTNNELWCWYSIPSKIFIQIKYIPNTFLNLMNRETWFKATTPAMKFPKQTSVTSLNSSFPTFSWDCGFPRRFWFSLYIISSILAWASSSRSVMGRLASILRTLMRGSDSSRASHQRSCTFSRFTWDGM